MAAYIWTGVVLAILTILLATRNSDRRMKAQGRSVRSSSDILRDGRDAKSDARAYGNRLAAPNTAASREPSEVGLDAIGPVKPGVRRRPGTVPHVGHPPHHSNVCSMP